MIRCREVTGVFFHLGKALFAAFTAALNSSLVVKGILDTTSCVAYYLKKQHLFFFFLGNEKLAITKKRFREKIEIYWIDNID